MSVRCIVATAVMTGLLIMVPAANAQLVFEQRLTTNQPGAPSGARLHLVYPNGADGRPKQVTEAVYDFPAGTHIDERAVPTCSASDSDFNARGLDACPAKTGLGGGDLTAITGCGPPIDPFRTDLHTFHGPGQLVNAVTPHGAERPILSVARIKIDGNRFVDRPVLPPGCPPPNGRAAPHEVQLELLARTDGAGRSFLTAPPTCPPSAVWTSKVAIRFTDGANAAATSDAPCVRRRPPSRATMRLSITPRRVRAGRRVTLKARVTSPAARCRNRVKVRFGNRRFRTEGRGRARLVLTLHRAGRRTVGARKPGCQTALASVRVVRASAAER